MIQQGVSDSETPLSIGRVMDWVEARLEAVRAREEEELEEDEETSSKKEGQASKLKASSSLARASSAPAVPQQHQSPREQPVGFFLPFPLRHLPLPTSLSVSQKLTIACRTSGASSPVETIADDHCSTKYTTLNATLPTRPNSPTVPYPRS
jgi:hypothetical protein